MTKIKQPIGYIKGEGCGPDIIEAALLILKEIGAMQNLQFRFIEYKGKAPALEYTKESYEQLKKFYSRVKIEGGCIIRGGIYARQVYKLRHEFQMTFKPILISPIPELFENSPFKKNFAKKINLLLIRENAQGLLMSEEKLRKKRVGKIFEGKFYYDESLCERFVYMCYKEALKRKKQIMFLIKGDVWNRKSFGGMWLNLWEKVSKKYPDVKFDWEHPDTWFGYFIAHPEKYDTVVALGLSGDLLSDPIATLAYGTRTVTPSANISPDGFMSFQTIHGAGTEIPKGTANPIAMIRSVGLMMDYFFGMPELRIAIDRAIRSVLKNNYRTADVYRRSNAKHILVKTTKEMTDLIIDQIKKFDKK